MGTLVEKRFLMLCANTIVIINNYQQLSLYFWEMELLKLSAKKT